MRHQETHMIMMTMLCKTKKVSNIFTDIKSQVLILSTRSYVGEDQPISCCHVCNLLPYLRKYIIYAHLVYVGRSIGTLWRLIHPNLISIYKFWFEAVEICFNLISVQGFWSRISIIGCVENLTKCHMVFYVTYGNVSDDTSYVVMDDG